MSPLNLNVQAPDGNDILPSQSFMANKNLSQSLNRLINTEIGSSQLRVLFLDQWLKDMYKKFKMGKPHHQLK